MKYPDTKEQAIALLQQVKNGLGADFSEHLILYCLLLTGDLV
jgi:hypothetical protein